MRILNALVSVALISPAITAYGRPSAAPTVRHEVLEYPTGNLPAVRVSANASIDVFFSSEETDWRWDVTGNRAVRTPTRGDTTRRSAHGNHAATVDSTREITIVDLSNYDTYGTRSFGIPAIHDDYVAWGARNGIEVFHAPSRFRTFLAQPLGSNDVRIWEDWITATDANSRLITIHRPSGRTVVENRIPGQHDMATGRTIYAEGAFLVWEHIGLPETASRVRLDPDCRTSSDHRLGGSWGQLVAYVGSDCGSGESELIVLNLDSGESYYVGSLAPFPLPFDIQGNVVTFVDDSKRINVMVIDESSM